MIFWTLFLPGIAITFILYFQYYGQLYRGKKEIYRIDKELPARIQRIEFKLTLTSLLIFTGAGLFTGYIVATGWTRLYKMEQYSIPSILYAMASLFLALFIQDIYFYWSHRFLHLEPAFRNIHFL